MEKDITQILRYFAQFSYPPTLDELYIFLRSKSTKSQLNESLKTLKQQGKVQAKKARYTLGEYSINLDTTIQRQQWSDHKKMVAQHYIEIVSRFPFIKLIGISGSVAMSNATEMDDFDLFIITQQKRMWITRVYCLIVAQLLGKRRKRHDKLAKDKICLNLFFEEQNLQVPPSKKTEYVAHEVLQMKPLFSRGSSYEHFLTANAWIYDFFPNAQKNTILKHQNTSNNIKNSKSSLSFFTDLVEQLLKRLQLFIINKHRTKEIITDTQLWFFPRDYEKILKKSNKK